MTSLPEYVAVGPIRQNKSLITEPLFSDFSVELQAKFARPGIRHGIPNTAPKIGHISNPV